MKEIQAKLESLKPILEAAGRSITIKEAKDDQITFVLQGFCGGCDCSQSYKDGLTDMVAEYCPSVKEVHFEEK